MRPLPRLAAVFAVASLLMAGLDRPPDTLADPDRAGPARHRDQDGVALPDGALARVGSTRLRLDGYAYHLKYSPDGTLLASLGFHTLQVWDARTGALVRRVELPARELTKFSGHFTATGKSVVVFDGHAARWFDARSGEETQHLDVDLQEIDATLAPRGEMAAALAEEQKYLAVLDLPSGKERFRKACSPHVLFPLTFSPDGKTLAVRESNSPGGTIRLLDTKAGQEVGAFRIKDVFNPGLAFSPDGKRFIAWYGERTIDDTLSTCSLRSFPSGKLLRHVELPAGRINAAAYTPDGKLLFAGMDDREARVLWVDPDTGQELRRSRIGLDASFLEINSLAFTPDGTGLAVGHGGYVSQWDLATGRRRAASAQLGNHARRFSADGQHLWMEREGFLALVDWRSGRDVRRVPREGQSAFLILSPDASRVAGTNAAGKLVVWDAGSGREVSGFDVAVPLSCLPDYYQLNADASGGAGRWLGPPIFSADGRKLYVVAPAKRLRVLDVPGGKEEPAYEVTSDLLSDVVSDGRQLASASMKSEDAPVDVLVWDLANRREVRRFAAPAEAFKFDPLAFSSDGRLLAFQGAECATASFTVWDVRTGKQKFAATELDYRPKVAAFSPDGRLLAVGDSAGTVRLWEIATGRERSCFAGRTGAPIEGVVFSPDGKFLATSSHHDACLVWDMEGRNGQPPSETPFAATEADRLWAGLNDPDAARAFEAMRELSARPGPAVALLRDRLPPAPAIDPQAVRRHLNDLDSDTFAVRERAGAALDAIAERVAPLLREALANRPSAEVRRQLQRLLEAADDVERYRLRELRAVEVAERLGTAAARDLLRTWAGGDVGALQTRAAREAVERLKGRKD